MSTDAKSEKTTAAADANITPMQREAMKYLEEHDVNKKLNAAVNKLCKAKVDDPLGYLGKLLLAEAKAPRITRLVGREILDSRGNPTVEVELYATVSGEERMVARGAAPSGASTGSNEAKELRDTEKKDRYLGKGVQTVVKNVDTACSAAVTGMDPRDLSKIDNALIKADGTKLKERLGGNALTAVSFAAAHAGASLNEKQLFLHLASFFHTAGMPTRYTLPRPMVNILNGGKHAGGDLKVQEFMIVPRAGVSYAENLRIVTTVYHHLGKILVREKGPSAKNLGDEGGFAPPLKSPNEALTYIEKAIEAAGFRAGHDVFLALDCAASEFYDHDTKKYEIEKGVHLDTEHLIKWYVDLKRAHPAIISIEDGLDEKDYDGWIRLTETMQQEFKGEVMIVGDDLFTTNTDLISQGMLHKWATALLLKVNQIGTIMEAMQAAKMLFDQKLNVVVSHRSGETTDTLIADLTVGIGAQFIKTGATARGERVAKYNRLLQIEDYLRQQNLLAL